jgi:hypothetical protein
VVIVVTRLALTNDTLSLILAQKAAFNAKTLSIATRFNNQEFQRQASKIERKSDNDCILKAIMSIKIDRSTLYDSIATCSINLCQVTKDLATKKRARVMPATR